MNLQYANLTDQCGSFEEYDGHVVHGLVTEDNKVALATFIHRRSAGLQTIDGATLESGGGCRITLPNGSDHASFSVGMLLSSMMSQKFAAIFGDSKLALGGGKTVVFTHNVPEVLGDVRVNEVRQELWRAFAEEILARINTYLTSFDMGMTREDLEYIACYAPRGLVIGHRDGTDPSPVTADGVLLALEETWRMYGDDGDDVAALYEKQTFALQGIGNVGFALLSRLLERGVRHITIADTNAQSIERARRLDGDIIRVVEPDAIYGVKARIFMPCAKGGILNSRTISNMRSSTNMIVGSANNHVRARTHV